MAKKGDRVMAVSHSGDGKVYVFGEGVYVGDTVPGPEATGVFAALCREAGRPNPKIELDSGQVVWGCECWWGSLEDSKKTFEGAEVVMVSIEEVRERMNSTGR